MRDTLWPAALAATVLWPVALFGQTPTLTCDRQSDWGNGERVCEIREIPITTPALCRWRDERRHSHTRVGPR